MLDEPSLGLAPLLVNDIFDIIEEIHNQGNTILLVEQNANMALQFAHRAYIIQNGKIDFEGDSQDLLNNDKVKAAYLGG